VIDDDDRRAGGDKTKDGREAGFDLAVASVIDDQD
jgi:hypothetical protein